MIIKIKRGEHLFINNDIDLVVTDISGSQVKIGINAPNEIKIYRKEIYDRIQAEKQSDTKEVDDNETKKTRQS